jgi:hypothetical protein
MLHGLPICYDISWFVVRIATKAVLSGSQNVCSTAFQFLFVVGLTYRCYTIPNTVYLLVDSLSETFSVGFSPNRFQMLSEIVSDSGSPRSPHRQGLNCKDSQPVSTLHLAVRSAICHHFSYFRSRLLSYLFVQRPEGSTGKTDAQHDKRLK